MCLVEHFHISYMYGLRVLAAHEGLDYTVLHWGTDHEAFAMT